MFNKLLITSLILLSVILFGGCEAVEHMTDSEQPEHSEEKIEKPPVKLTGDDGFDLLEDLIIQEPYEVYYSPQIEGLKLEHMVVNNNGYFAEIIRPVTSDEKFNSDTLSKINTRLDGLYKDKLKPQAEINGGRCLFYVECIINNNSGNLEFNMKTNAYVSRYKNPSDSNADVFETTFEETFIYKPKSDTVSSTAPNTTASNNNEKIVALTFDDGPSSYTDIVLDALKKYDIKATFFMVGSRMSDFKKVAKRVADEGHEIGNHSWSHPGPPNYPNGYNSMTSAAVVADLKKASDAIFEVTGVNPTIMRPPGGSISKVQSAVQMPIIHWSVDPNDWKDRNTDTVVERVLSNVKNGDIILMHDIYKTTANAVESIVIGLIEKGFTCVTVSELLGLDELGEAANTVMYYSKTSSRKAG